MKEYTDKEIRAAVVIQKQFRKYLDAQKKEDEWIDKLLNEQTPVSFEETL